MDLREKKCLIYPRNIEGIYRMGKICSAGPVKLFMGIIAVSEGIIEECKKCLQENWGIIDIESELIPFNFTDYYEKEMGMGLFRKWVSFEKLADPAELAAIKTATNAIEQKYLSGDRRTINLDPGYITLANLVLASTKEFSHRIYLSGGIYGEITLIYKGGKFTPLPWTYPDYQSQTAIKFIEKTREKYHSQIR